MAVSRGGTVNSEAGLWRAVLSQAIRDIYSGCEKERQEVLIWIGSNDFADVCYMADADPDNMREQLLALSSISKNLAMKYGKRLRDYIMADI